MKTFAYFHGGNVEKEFSQLYDGEKKIDEFIALGTPNRDDYVFDTDDLSSTGKYINVYDKSDMVQRLGGIDFENKDLIPESKFNLGK